MSKVLFRVDAGAGIGAGHMMRSLALAEALCARGGSVSLLTSSSSPLPMGWASLNAEVVRCAETELGDRIDLSMTSELAEKIKADWVVVDGYHFTSSWLSELRQSRRLLYLDDLGKCDVTGAVVLNQNAGAELNYRDAYRHCQRRLLGLKWFLLGSVWRSARYEPESGRLLMTLGGNGSTVLMLALMRALINRRGRFFADVVVTSVSAELMRFAKEHADYFNVQQGPLPLTPLMARAEVVICGGGVTPIEALSMGAIPVIVTLADNQVPGASRLVAMGAARMSSADDNGVQSAACMAQELLDNPGARCAMAAVGRTLVDGEGPERVVQVMTDEST